MNHTARRRILLSGILLSALLVPACSENNQGSSSQGKRMLVSTGKYNQGYKDGQRDAKSSLFDASSAWMWAWMTEQEYQDGYERGWHDGREAVKLETRKKDRQGQPPPPAKDVDIPAL